ncbi:unnamed protein product [Spodoptera exigua]|nr:unnamed protein product [Spodoptera exigua]
MERDSVARLTTAASLGKLCAVAAEEDTESLARRLDARLALASQHAALPAALRLRHGLGPADCAVLPPDDLVQVLHTLLYFNTGAAPGRAPGAGLAARRAARRAAPAPRPGARRLRRAAARRPRAGTTHIVVLQYWRGAWTRAWRWPRSTPRCPPRCACATAWGPPTAPCCRPTTSCRYYTHCCTSILARRLDARLALASQHAALPAALRLRHGLGPADCAVLPPDDLVQMYIDSESKELTEYDYKKALDLTDFVEDMEKRDDLRLRVWCACILADDWSSVRMDAPAQDLADKMFFRLIDLVHLMGADVSVVVPAAEDVLTAPELAELAADSRFHYLLRYGYQCLPTGTH